MRAFAILMASLALSACSVQKLDSADEAKAAFESYISALNNGDTEAAAAVYDSGPGFHWIERGGVQYASGAAAANSLRELAKSSGESTMTIEDVQVASMSADSALVSAHFEYVMEGAAGEQGFSFDGWMTVGMVKREDGWKIAGGQTGPGKSSVTPQP
ncbi:nuclear transport factor 2 family protein [Altererythrobacter sp. ZODW24]|uniref:YybH family protein n=1 Tax=Altererythrobacter sp. ZODW24 TaxID=2185142 RepID=UPI0013B368C7|nr:nuclear transport factor 2 family protein [Altererythrobacter sp. ZODW24]